MAHVGKQASDTNGINLLGKTLNSRIVQGIGDSLTGERHWRGAPGFPGNNLPTTYQYRRTI